MSPRPRYPRSSCCVPGCRRTSTLFTAEWVCGDHWRMIPRRFKLAWSRAKRHNRRHWLAMSERRRRAAHYRMDRLWLVLKRAAIIAAAGL